ncbi:MULTISPECIES: hypothetical protein [unclassified Streptomyces]|uniref:hypothetical protein n=1 Tax=unclassified Streptomyces TaxID=2593676 RepID=UPI000A74B903|nr:MULTISPECIES: hypothetical protein [unclassified Streptomyces]
MRQEWSPEDVVACWTPVGPDWELVANRSGPTRLGFVLMLIRLLNRNNTAARVVTTRNLPWT